MISNTSNFCARHNFGLKKYWCLDGIPTTSSLVRLCLGNDQINAIVGGRVLLKFCSKLQKSSHRGDFSDSSSLSRYLCP